MTKESRLENSQLTLNEDVDQEIAAILSNKVGEFENRNSEPTTPSSSPAVGAKSEVYKISSAAHKDPMRGL